MLTRDINIYEQELPRSRSIFQRIREILQQLEEIEADDSTLQRISISVCYEFPTDK